MSNNFDLFVIGAGSGGVRAARSAARRGLSVGLAEPQAFGGTCVNVGCVPKKLYSYAAGFSQSFTEAQGFGWTSNELEFDWSTLKSNKANEISRLNRVYEGLVDSSGVAVFRGHARVASPHGVTVRDSVTGALSSVVAERILICTGSRPFVPDIPGREYGCVSDAMFDIDPLPRRLLVLGSGYIACEFASIFHGLGSDVIQAYRSEEVLRGFDHDIRRLAGSEMRSSGVRHMPRSNITAIRRGANGLKVTLNGANSDSIVQVADRVLFATGRVPHTGELGLGELGVELTSTGAIKVDENYQTSVPSIYALGDVTGRIQLTPTALAEANVFVDRMCGVTTSSVDYEFVPTAVFSHPNVATVGYSETQAKEKFQEIDTYMSSFKPLRSAFSSSAERCHMKLVVRRDTDQVVGLHMIGADAGEIVQGFSVAIRAGATKKVFDTTIGIHPTAAEEFVTMRTASSSPAQLAVRS